MRISLGTRLRNINDRNGYGYATVNMIDSLERLGYEVTRNDPTADVEIWFNQPHVCEFSDGPYKVLYHPWESTKLKKGWVDIMNQVDEVWTPSPLIADWYRADGVRVPVHVYEHGVDPRWTHVDRKVEDSLTFLHVGMEAARKGGSETMRAFRAAFHKEDDVRLTMKTIGSGWKIPNVGRTTILDRSMPLDELISLFHRHHVFVYPSWGEGFGLNPLQAMRTGMPTITVPAWAPYERFLDPNLNIGSKLVWSQWSRTHHPGKMFKPDFDDIVDRMRYAYDNYDECLTFASRQVESIDREYDWDSLTKSAFENLANRLEKSSKSLAR